jgi:ABC-type transport system involved in cytochrome c biogenesis permease subunit
MTTHLSALVLLLSALCYGAAFLLHSVSFAGSREGSHRPAFALMRLGFLIATFYFAAETIEHGFFLPVVNFSQAMAFFAWSLAFVYLVLVVSAQSDSFGLILSPILLTLTLASFWAKMRFGYPDEIKSVLLNPYFLLHIACAFFAYACFTLSFAAGILYLVQSRELKSKAAGTFYHKLPSLEQLEKLIYQPLVWGAPLLAVALGIGMLWSKSEYGQAWILDPKTIATAVTAIFYFVILYRRTISAAGGKQVAVWSLFAFVLVVFSFVGTRFIPGSHNFVQ